MNFETQLQKKFPDLYNRPDVREFLVDAFAEMEREKEAQEMKNRKEMKVKLQRYISSKSNEQNIDSNFRKRLLGLLSEL